jgi:hypothetical protein
VKTIWQLLGQKSLGGICRKRTKRKNLKGVTMRVRKGGLYVYRAALWDAFDPKTDLKDGERVRVVHRPGCPAPNVMSHCHVERLSGEFCGLVETVSLNKE